MADKSALASRWDLTALFNAADPKAAAVERHLWVIYLVDWLRRAPLSAARDATPADAGPTTTNRLAALARGRAAGKGGAPVDAAPRPVVRLRHLLGVLDRNPDQQQRAAQVLRRFLREVDSAALLADFGFAPRTGLWAEFAGRLRAHVLPLTPATTDLGDLFTLLFPDRKDLAWLRAIDDATLARIVAVLDVKASIEERARPDWRIAFFDAITFLGSAIRASGFSPGLRRRMSSELLAESPFHQLARVSERVAELGVSKDPADRAGLLQEAQYLRALLDTCRSAADSVHQHLESNGVSVDVVFDVDQLRKRADRIDLLLTCVIAPNPAREIVTLIGELIVASDERRSVRALFGQHYSLLAKKVAERSAASGEHYIARNSGEYLRMLRAAIGGGAVLGLTTMAWFFIVSLPLGTFWRGLGTGLNYAISFMVIQHLHGIVATKQPAMTAPALADKLADVTTPDGVGRFVDEVAHLIRSQVAGIIGNLLGVIPVVLLVQWLATLAFGKPLVGAGQGTHMLGVLTLLGPTALFAAFTGVILFASSMVAGWAENWFVWHRLDSAIEWNPRFVARLGQARARRWSAYWRANVSTYAANLSLGLLLGLVPAIATFFSLPVDVRHVTLGTGELFTAVGAMGQPLLRSAAFWWCVAGIAATGALNLGVSFWLAFRVALRSRDIRVVDRGRIHRAIRARLWRAPFSFVLPTGAA